METKVMTKKILTFGASSSKNSINKQLANYVAHQVPNSEVDLIDLNDFEMPIYSIDREQQDGVHQLALDFLDKVKNADGIVISFAEHNGAYSVAFKNVFDWASRHTKNVWMNKPMFLLATSPGSGGGRIVLNAAYQRFSHMSLNLVEELSVPNFNDSFNASEGFLDVNFEQGFQQKLENFTNAL